MTHPFVVAVTGASGAIYAVRLLDVLVESGADVHLTMSESGVVVLKQELGVDIDLRRFNVGAMIDLLRPESPIADHPVVRSLLQKKAAAGEKPTRKRPAVVYHHCGDFMSPIASGSFLTAGMVICPCSGSTLSGIAHGSGNNLVQRAADVHLKERRKLIVVPRETPLSVVQLENMRRVVEAGGVVLPAMPGWYHGVDSLADLVDFVVARILDQLGVEHQLMRRWGAT